jgi:hypothetical protein
MHLKMHVKMHFKTHFKMHFKNAFLPEDRKFPGKVKLNLKKNILKLNFPKKKTKE